MAPTWMAWAPLAFALIAVCAAFVARWNARRSSVNADRQHAASYSGDLSQWGADMLDFYRIASSSYEEKISPEIAFSRIKKAGNNFIFLFGKLALLVPSLDSDLAKEALAVSGMAKADVFMLARAGANTSVDKYDESRTRFIQSIRHEIGVSKRYSDARKYLT